MRWDICPGCGHPDSADCNGAIKPDGGREHVCHKCQRMLVKLLRLKTEWASI